MNERIIVLDDCGYALVLTFLEQEFAKCNCCKKVKRNCKQCYYDVLKGVLDSFDNYHESGMLFGKVEMAGKKFR